ESFDEPFKFTDCFKWIVGCAIAVHERKEIDRGITPVVEETLLGLGVPFFPLPFVKFQHWHQLYCIDAELLQVGNFVDHPCKSPFVYHPARGIASKSTHMHLVEDEILLGVKRGSYGAPIERFRKDLHAAGDVRFSPPSISSCNCFSVRVE